jgi:outer membrane protein
MLDVGYNISDSVAVQAMVGIPPRPTAKGKGAVEPLGKLGAVRLGPVVATAVYRLPALSGFRPYVGAGGTYVFILKNYDGAVTDVDTRGNWGFALQGGVEYRLNRRVELFADYKRLWVAVKTEGMLGPAPVRARVTLDPDLVSAGIKLNF